jgi:hypothetical protein
MDGDGYRGKDTRPHTTVCKYIVDMALALIIQFFRIFITLTLSTHLLFCKLYVKVVYVRVRIPVYVRLCPFPRPCPCPSVSVCVPIPVTVHFCLCSCPCPNLSLSVCVPLPVRLCPCPSVSQPLPVCVPIHLFICPIASLSLSVCIPAVSISNRLLWQRINFNAYFIARKINGYLLKLLFLFDPFNGSYFLKVTCPSLDMNMDMSPQKVGSSS